MFTKNIRKEILKMAHYSKASHIGSCLSVVDILVVLYFRVMNIDPNNPLKEERDKLIFSKGHASAALYACLAEKGFFPKEYLNKYYIDGGILPGHLDKDSVPGIEVSAGSLGHGLSIGIGMALANRIDHNPGHIYVILGDGECNEGSIWEAAMMASALKLNNLTAIVDCNGLQGFGTTDQITGSIGLDRKFEAFGWEVYQVDGHNVRQLEETFVRKQIGPKVIVANTIKGKGISFMEDKLEWHYKSPNDTEYDQALAELDCADEE